MDIKILKKLIAGIILSTFLYSQSCFAMNMQLQDRCTNQNLAPVLHIESNILKGYFKEDITFEKLKSQTKNSFIKITDDIKDDQELLVLLNRLNKLGPLDEKGTILNLLVMANGVKSPVVKLMGFSASNFYNKLKKYGLKDDFISQANVQDIFIKSGLARLQEDGSLFLEMKDMSWGLSKQMLKALADKIIIKHKLYDNGQLGRFEGVNYKFTKRSNEDVEVTVEYGNITSIKFLSDNTYDDKIFVIYDNQGRLIDSTRQFGVKIKELKDNIVVVTLNKRGGIPTSEASGARLEWSKGKYYTHYDGRKFELAGKKVKLIVKHSQVVQAILLDDNIELSLNVVYDADSDIPVYSSVVKITQERMQSFGNHYVLSRLVASGTLEAGGKTWCTLSDYPNHRIRYFLKQGWVSDVEVYDEQKENLLRKKTIHLVYDKHNKIVDFLRIVSMEDIAKLDEHKIDFVLEKEWIYIANNREEYMSGSKGRIYLHKILPSNVVFPQEGRLIIKDGIIEKYECAIASTDNFYYGIDSKTKKALFYFNGMGRDVFDQLDNVTIIKKINKSRNQGALNLGAGKVHISFPDWAVGNWVMFDIKKQTPVTEVTFLAGKNHKKVLKDANGKKVVYSKKQDQWQLSCDLDDLPDYVKQVSSNMNGSNGANLKDLAEQFTRFKSKNDIKIVKEKEKNLEEKFLKFLEEKFKAADKSYFTQLYVLAKEKEFALQEVSAFDNLVDLCRFARLENIAEKEELTYIQKQLMPRASFVHKAKLILSDREYRTSVEMFFQIKGVYMQYKQNRCTREEASFLCMNIFEEWRERLAGYTDATIDDKVFVSFLASRLMKIFFKQQQASFDEASKTMTEFNIGLMDLNEPMFLSKEENLDRIYKLNEQLLKIGWQIRFMKSDGNHKAKKRRSRYMSVDEVIKLSKYLKQQGMDFDQVRNGDYKPLSPIQKKEFEEHMGYPWRQLVYQAIIGNLSMVDASEQKITDLVFNKWYVGLKGLKSHLVEHRKKEVLENLNIIFDNGFTKNISEIEEGQLKREVLHSLFSTKFCGEAI